MKPSISVIIPAYNAEKYIERCLDSVFSQTFNNLQVIVINDGSLDNTGTILQKLKIRYSNLIVIEQENSGVSKARNVGIDAATSEYLAFVDADDTIDNDYFEKLISALQEKKADIAVCGCKNIDTNIGKLLFTDSPIKHKIELGDGDCIVFWGAPWGKLIKSSLIKHKCYFTEGVLFEDDPYSIMLHSLADNVIPINYLGYNYFVNNPNSSMGIEAREKKFIERFPYSAYENAIKKVIEFENPKCFNRLQIYYLRNMMALFHNQISKRDGKEIRKFHYDLCKKYSLTKKIKQIHMPLKERIKIDYIRYATRFHLI